MALASAGVMSPARRPGAPLGIANMVRRVLEEDVAYLPRYFASIRTIALAESVLMPDGTYLPSTVPARQQLEAAVYLVNRHLGTPTSMIDVKSVSDSRLSGADLLEIAQLVSQSMHRPILIDVPAREGAVLIPHPHTTEAPETRGLSQSNDVHSPLEAQCQL